MGNIVICTWPLKTLGDTNHAWKKKRKLGNLVPRKFWHLEENFYLWNKEKHKEMEGNLPMLEGNNNYFDWVPGKKGIFSSRDTNSDGKHDQALRYMFQVPCTNYVFTNYILTKSISWIRFSIHVLHVLSSLRVRSSFQSPLCHDTKWLKVALLAKSMI